MLKGNCKNAIEIILYKFKLNRYLIIFINSLLLMISCNEANQKEGSTVKKPNILFIIVDDLRPELGCYGHSEMITPNIDELAKNGIKFTNSFSNVPVCGASRASLLTGIYPTRSKFLNYDSRADMDSPDAVALHDHLGKHGYSTYSIGKVFHKAQDHADKWTTKPWLPEVPNVSKNYYLPKNIERQSQPNLVGPTYEREQVNDDFYVDGKISSKAINMLDSLQHVDSPFFLAIGYIRPHLPFTVPAKYWDLYDESKIQLPDNYYWPKDTPLKDMFQFDEIRKYQNVPEEGAISDTLALKLIHGYKASVSYVDAMIGKVINKLKATGKYEETIILLLGDHGFMTGEHSLWCKHATFDNALRAPLIVKTPNGIKNKEVSGLVEFIDIYPTICDLVGVKKPSQLEGTSLLNVIKNKDDEPEKMYLFSRFENMEAVKTKDFLYTQFIDENGLKTHEWLFDHRIDPQENQNVAFKPEYKSQIDSIRAVLSNHIKHVNN